MIHGLHSRWRVALSRAQKRHLHLQPPPQLDKTSLEQTARASDTRHKTQDNKSPPLLSHPLRLTGTSCASPSAYYADERRHGVFSFSFSFTFTFTFTLKHATCMAWGHWHGHALVAVVPPPRSQAAANRNLPARAILPVYHPLVPPTLTITLPFFPPPLSI
ncbi:hypothetical protein GQ44DRAFT_71057 [Phaeosphaeriaceae sp. PMI808]|nr:hypothetical protein GQ44DRAFT_71057 [Phaeosphaeriaceae sp. PMI808]